MGSLIKIFPDPETLAGRFAENMIGLINESATRNRLFSVALSGGSTPELLFRFLASHYPGPGQWENVHFFWGDERCVAPENSESNYGMAKKLFLDMIYIPSGNIHRIRGEEEPESEAARYSKEILSNIILRNNLPVFDLVILGLGEDGHTASVFPGNTGLLASDRICETALHPVTGQKRITITGRVINNAAQVAFLVAGKKKAAVVRDIINKTGAFSTFPASFVVPVYGSLNWFLDENAGSLL